MSYKGSTERVFGKFKAFASKEALRIKKTRGIYAEKGLKRKARREMLPSGITEEMRERKIPKGHAKKRPLRPTQIRVIRTRKVKG